MAVANRKRGEEIVTSGARTLCLQRLRPAKGGISLLRCPGLCRETAFAAWQQPPERPQTLPLEGAWAWKAPMLKHKYPI